MPNNVRSIALNVFENSKMKTLQSSPFKMLLVQTKTTATDFIEIPFANDSRCYQNALELTTKKFEYFPNFHLNHKSSF